jgi:hypothetical protein
MNSVTRRTLPFWWPSILALVLLFASVAAYTGKPAMTTGEAAANTPQDVTRIESRLSQLEQRFYSIEASIRNLEQQTRLSSGMAGRSTRDPEVLQLRAEVEALRQRLAEAECGLVRLDERTLTPAAREARRKSAGNPADPCRLNADAPLRLLTRP